MAEPRTRLDPAVAEVTRVYRELKRFAIAECRRANCVGPNGVVTGTGKSPEDLASDAIIILHTRGWQPGTGQDDVVPLGRVIIRNKVTDIVRSRAYTTSVALDIEELENRKEARVEVTPLTLIEIPMIYKKFERTVKDEREKKYMRAAENGAQTPKEFAEELGTTPEEAEKIRKRLKYRALKMRDMW